MPPAPMNTAGADGPAAAGGEQGHGLRIDAVDAMRAALAHARLAFDSDDVPVGAVLLDADGSVLAHARNEREALQDPTAHAEVLAIRRAAEARRDWHLENTTLVVTLEPCVLCAGAILAARIPRVVFGAWDEKAGAVGSVHDLLRDRRLPHRVEVTAGVLAEESAALLREFFEGRRAARSRQQRN